MNETRIFVGKVHRVFFAYLKSLFEHLKEKYSTLIIPACGEFTVAEIAVLAGFPPERIFNSDISLYSTTIHARANGMDFEKFLEIHQTRFKDTAEDYWKRISETAGRSYESLLLLMKVLQLDEAKFFEFAYIKEYLQNARTHTERIGRRLDKVSALLAQTHFEHADLMDVVAAHRDDPKALLFLNPPNIADGYTKLFGFEEMIEWNRPAVGHFDPKRQLDQLYKIFFAARALGLAYGSTRNDNFVESHGIAVAEEKDRAYSVICNRPEEIPSALRFVKPYRNISVKPLPYKLVDETTEITESSKIELVRARAENALYYRNLWCHRLGVTRAESYFIWLIDKQVAGVVGFNTADARRLRSSYIYETFGFSAQAKRWPRLNRLLMMCMVSAPTRDTLRATIFKTNNPLIEFAGIRTTCITKYRENRANKGVLTLVSSEKQPNDTYLLKYETNWFERTYTDCLKIWLKEGYGKPNGSPEGT